MNDQNRHFKRQNQFEIWLHQNIKLPNHQILLPPYLQINKDENVHRYALSAKRGVLLERERERERDSCGILYTG